MWFTVHLFMDRNPYLSLRSSWVASPSSAYEDGDKGWTQKKSSKECARYRWQMMEMAAIQRLEIIRFWLESQRTLWLATATCRWKNEKLRTGRLNLFCKYQYKPKYHLHRVKIVSNKIQLKAWLFFPKCFTVCDCQLLIWYWKSESQIYCVPTLQLFKISSFFFFEYFSSDWWSGTI